MSQLSRWTRSHEPESSSLERRTRPRQTPRSAPCEALDARDQLFRSIREACRAGALYNKLAIHAYGCDQSTSAAAAAACLRLYNLGRELMSVLIALQHRADGAIRRSALTHACQDVLARSRADYAFENENYRLLGLSARAATTGSAGARQRSIRLGTRISVMRAKLPTAQARLARFRRACA